MNQAHLDYLASTDWADRLETDLLPWIESGPGLGDHVIEVGPGPGLTTDILRERAAQVTAVELDEALATALRARLDGTNVDVVHGDAADTHLPADHFTAATCFSMLHHVPTPDQQDAILTELHRVLRPGAALFGVDARDTDLLRAFHEDDTFVPFVDHDITPRLERAGFSAIELEITDYEIRFRATK